MVDEPLLSPDDFLPVIYILGVLYNLQAKGGSGALNQQVLIYMESEKG